MIYFLKKLFEIFWLSLLLVIVTIFFLTKLTNIRDPQIFNVVLGIALGVVLGFVADFTKRSLDDFQKWLNLRKIALRLLKQDAIKIYRTMWLYERLINDRNIQEEGKKQLPPLLEMKYWSILSKDLNFLTLGTEEPFKKIFELMWELEKINEQIVLARQQDELAYRFAMAFYKYALEEKQHKKLLSIFMKERDILDMENQWLGIAKNKK